jgi:hypothetical protein
MALSKHRVRNVRSTKVQLSRVKALKFKKSAAKSSAIAMEVIQEHVGNITIASPANEKLPVKKLMTKKKLLRSERKDAMRKCLAAKRLKYKITSGTAMEGAPLPTEEEDAAKAAEQKLNPDRIKKDTLPIKAPAKTNQLKVRAKELITSNVVSGRRMSKKKARKMINAMKRDEREAERKATQMDVA